MKIKIFWIKHWLYILKQEGLNRNKHDLKWRKILIQNYFWVMIRALRKL